MGVPAFYRWLSEKYPKIVVDMVEDRAVHVEGVEIPIDLTAANPNGIEFDNLYIDMNGIIHPCSHPEDKPAPESEEAMYKNIMDYVDRLFSAVRPRRLLYLAIDGVAPRAKMNQQRSRRFRSAQEAEEAKALMDETREAMKEMGLKVPPKVTKKPWDSNIITPGTSFMYKLSKYLRFYIQDRVNRNKAWQNIKVILSDANEPGEGEHKIMDFVRRQRAQPGYDPNQHHVLHGLDADLIMLGLATHERSFTILREQVLFGRKQREQAEKKQQALQQAQDALATGIMPPRDADGATPHKPLQMLQLWILREYLENEFRELSLPGRVPFGYDFERVVDDFVFLCFFVGNDFLPHLPSLDIRDGAIDYLFNVYKRVISSLGDYLTSGGGVVNLKQVDVIMSEVGEVEDEVFKRRRAAETAEQARRASQGSNSGGRGQGGRRPPHEGEASHSGGRSGSRFGNDSRGRYDSPLKGRYGDPPRHEREDWSRNGRHGHEGGHGYGSRSVRSDRADRHRPKGRHKAYSLGMATASEKRKAKHEAELEAKKHEDAMKDLAVPVSSVRTDRFKDAKRKLQEGGKTGASWGGGHENGDRKSAGAAEEANKSAAAKLREKLGGMKKVRKKGDNAVASLSATATTKGKRSNGGQEPKPGVAKNEADEADAEGADGDGEGQGGAPPPPHKQARVDGQVAVDSREGGRGAANSNVGDENALENYSFGNANGDQESVAPFEVDSEDEEADETKPDEDEDENEDEDGGPNALASTEEEIQKSKAYMKDRVKEKTQIMLDEMRESVDDTVRLGEEGWKERYYHDKCKVDDIEDGGGKERLFQTYVEGLCWVMLYYYRGCPSWTWYFPFHYAPFASDLINCDRFEMKFEESTPFRPMEQLMGVLPSASCEALPKPCRPLMMNKKSPIIDFYPKDVKCDPNGKPMPWLWVVLLPFIDEERLLRHLRPLYSKFTHEENERNSFGPSYLFANIRTSFGENMEAFLGGSGTETTETSAVSNEIVLPAEKWGGFGGNIEAPKKDVCALVGQTLEAPSLPVGVFQGMDNNQVVVTAYKMPPRGTHVCRMLPGVKMLERTLQPEDLVLKRPPRLNRNVSIAELGTGKFDKSGFRHGSPPRGTGQRMIRHHLSGGGGSFQGHQGYSSTQGYGHGYQAQPTTGFAGYSTRGYEDQHHMHQPTGNRRWGSQEPTPKRPLGQRHDSRSRDSQQSHRGYQQPYQQSPHSPRAQPYATPQQPQQVLYYPVASVPAPVTPVAQQQLAPATVLTAPAAFAPQATLVQGTYYQQAGPVAAPVIQAPAPAPVALYAVAPSQQAPLPLPQRGFSFQHPGYATQAGTSPAPAPAPVPASQSSQNVPTMDSLRSKLANALLQKNSAPVATPQGYYSYPPGSTASQQPPQAGYYAQGATVPQPAGAAPATGTHSNQRLRFDESGRPTWGGQPWRGGGGAR